MDILGIGPLEIIFIIIIALIVFGPKDMVKAGKTIGKFLRQVIHSPTWIAVQQTSREIRNLPNRLIKEAGIEEDMRDIQNILPDKKDIISSISPEEPYSRESEKKYIRNNEKNLDSDFSAWITPPANTDLSESPEFDNE